MSTEGGTQREERKACLEEEILLGELEALGLEGRELCTQRLSARLKRRAARTRRVATACTRVRQCAEIIMSSKKANLKKPEMM